MKSVSILHPISSMIGHGKNKKVQTSARKSLVYKHLKRKQEKNEIKTPK